MTESQKTQTEANQEHVSYSKSSIQDCSILLNFFQHLTLCRRQSISSAAANDNNTRSHIIRKLKETIYLLLTSP